MWINQGRLLLWSLFDELEDKEKEILLLQEKERTNTIIKWSFAGGILALGTIGFLVFKNQRQKRAKKREMYQRRQELMASKEELAKNRIGKCPVETTGNGAEA